MFWRSILLFRKLGSRSPDKERGEIVKAFIILNPGFKPTEELKSEYKVLSRAD